MPRAKKRFELNDLYNEQCLNMTYLGQPPSDRPRLLRSQVQRSILLGLVKISKVCARFLVHYGQDSSN